MFFAFAFCKQPVQPKKPVPTKKLLGASGGQESSVLPENGQTVQANSIAFQLSRRYYHGRMVLDRHAYGRYKRAMAQSILIFDFGTNEDGAQQARLKVEGWKQGFRLGNKMLLKFEREDSADNGEGEDSKSAEAKSKKKSAAKKENEEAAGLRLYLRLDFSDHEKISHQRWLDRIPSEEPFKSAAGETVRQGDAEFEKASEIFESLD